MRRQAADRGAKRFLRLIGKKSAKPSEPPNIGKILSTMTSSDILANAPLSAKLKVFSPVEAAEFAVSYLHMTLQLIPLRERWGMRKVLKLYNTLYGIGYTTPNINTTPNSIKSNTTSNTTPMFNSLIENLLAQSLGFIQG